MSRLRAATSIFFAVQEVCKGKPDAYKPIPEAVADVRAGVFESTQGNRGNDNDHGVNANGVGGEPSEGTDAHSRRALNSPRAAAARPTRAAGRRSRTRRAATSRCGSR